MQGLLPLARAVAAIGIMGSAPCLPVAVRADTPTTDRALGGRIGELETEVDGLRDEAEGITGTRNLHDGVRIARGRYYGLLVRRDELDEVIEEAGGTQEELEAYKQRMEDQSVITGGDVVQEGVEKAGEAVARQALSRGASRVLGWLGLALDVAEYGGKWALKQGDVAALEEAVEQNRVNLMDLYQVSIALSGQIDDAIADTDRMEEIQARDEEIYPELARLRERQRLLGTPARGRAVLDRASDAAGDEEERRKHSREGARMGVTPATNPGVVPGRMIDPGNASGAGQHPQAPNAPPQGHSQP